MSDRTKTELKSLINNLQSYLAELENDNLSEEFVRDRCEELIKASALRISQTASAKKELKRQETANMKALDQTLSKLKGDVLKQILPAIETLGYRGFVEKTGVSFSTVSELKNNGTSMKLERLLEIQSKVA